MAGRIRLETRSCPVTCATEVAPFFPPHASEQPSRRYVRPLFHWVEGIGQTNPAGLHRLIELGQARIGLDPYRRQRRSCHGHAQYRTWCHGLLRASAESNLRSIPTPAVGPFVQNDSFGWKSPRLAGLRLRDLVRERRHGLRRLSGQFHRQNFRLAADAIRSSRSTQAATARPSRCGVRFFKPSGELTSSGARRRNRLCSCVSEMRRNGSFRSFRGGGLRQVA